MTMLFMYNMMAVTFVFDVLKLKQVDDTNNNKSEMHFQLLSTIDCILYASSWMNKPLMRFQSADNDNDFYV